MYILYAIYMCLCFAMFFLLDEYTEALKVCCILFHFLNQIKAITVDYWRSLNQQIDNFSGANKSY